MKFIIEHAVTEAMVQSTFAQSLISIEACFIVSKQFELVTVLTLFDENDHFLQYAHEGKGVMVKSKKCI
jgi:hypothetical protein